MNVDEARAIETLVHAGLGGVRIVGETENWQAKVYVEEDDGVLSYSALVADRRRGGVDFVTASGFQSLDNCVLRINEKLKAVVGHPMKLILSPSDEMKIGAIASAHSQFEDAFRVLRKRSDDDGVAEL
jgi:hypothetical protein